jgi:hypothetical protein
MTYHSDGLIEEGPIVILRATRSGLSVIEPHSIAAMPV